MRRTSDYIYINMKFLELFKAVSGTMKTEKYLVGYEVEST